MNFFNVLIIGFFCLIMESIGFCFIVGCCNVVFKNKPFASRRKICRVLCQTSAIIVWGFFILENKGDAHRDRGIMLCTIGFLLIVTALKVCNFVLKTFERAKLVQKNNQVEKKTIKETVQQVKDDNMKRRLENASSDRNADEMEVVRYFFGDAGCMSDQEYFEKLATKREILASKSKVLQAVGLDDTQVSEIYPIYKEEYVPSKSMYSGNIKNAFANKSVNGFMISSRYHVSWTFFSDSQMINYDIMFDMDKDWKQENTVEIFYKDISNYSINNDVITMTLLSGQTHRLDLTGNINADATIQGLIQKIRESKN